MYPPPDLLPCDRAVYGDLVTFDVLEDPIVGGGFAALVVLGLQTVDGDDDREAIEVAPLARDLAHCTRDELDMDASLRQLGQDDAQFPIPHERFAADNRNVQGTVMVGKFDHAVDQFLALEVTQLPQRNATAEVLVPICVAAGTAKRTFTRDFDGKCRSVAAENPAPGGEDAFHLFTIA